MRLGTRTCSAAPNRFSLSHTPSVPEDCERSDRDVRERNQARRELQRGDGGAPQHDDDLRCSEGLHSALPSQFHCHRGDEDHDRGRRVLDEEKREREVDEEKSCSDAGQHLLPSVRVTAASARAADHHTTSPIFAIFLTNPAPSLEVAGACCAITLNDDGPQSLWVLVRF